MWTRRRFLETLGTSAALSVSPSNVLQGQKPDPQSQSNSPEIKAGHYVPVLHDNVARPLRYTPEKRAIVIRNGKEFFNRPLYGANIPFRCDGGDAPEFSLYLPGHGGNLRLGVASSQPQRAKWLFEFDLIVTSYDRGCLVYTLKDSLLGPRAVIDLQVLTMGAALWLQVTPSELPRGIDLIWAFGGVSGRKGARGGDIGCESEPVSAFFQMRPQECRGNIWILPQNTEMGRALATVKSGNFSLSVDSGHGSALRIGKAEQWNHGWNALWASGFDASDLPLLLGRVALKDQIEVIRVTVVDGVDQTESSLPSNANLASDGNISARFARRQKELNGVAERLFWSTPDPYLDGIAGALGIASNAIWDERQGCVMHGAVAWRMPLAGWRGPYALDVSGDHDRMRRHLRHWIAKQNVSAIDNGSSGIPTPQGFAQIKGAEGAADPRSAQSRSEGLLHSSGDLSHNHYDMNLVFFDALLRHLNWTGDIEFAAEAWPALERHAAWERRLFRRDYGTAAEPLPLYEAYAAIWASDNLQYNGGGAAHSSAYNFYLNQSMAQLSELLKHPPEISAAYRTEADNIGRAMRKLLWMEDRGTFAESREWLGKRQLAVNPAVWTMYQVIDSEVVNRKEAWQVASERLRSLRKIPVIGEGVPKDAGWQIACSDWQPYMWSLTLLVLAENLATALALFQAGLADEGYALLRGNLIDAGYRGLCPGNFPMSLQLDPHRQEAQRDFGDPIGCASRAIVEGLWGLRPDLLIGRLRLVPQLPPGWTEATLRHPDVLVEYRYRERKEVWMVTPSFAKQVALSLELVARTTRLPKVTVNGRAVEAHFVDDAVGAPRIALETKQPGPWTVELEWQGEAPGRVSLDPLICIVGQPIRWPSDIQHHELDEPQKCLNAGLPGKAGRYCIFALQKAQDATFWMPIELSIAPIKVPERLPVRLLSPGHFESVDLATYFSGSVREILTRNYSEPRSSFCSLNLPDSLLGGWANFDARAKIDDSGMRRSGGRIALADGLHFLTPSDPSSANCCYVSHWAIDPNFLKVTLGGRARKLHFLLVGTTFPQATGSTHATIEVSYRDAQPPTVVELRSPQTWWPVEQDYPLDDYVFLLGDEAEPLPWRVDLATGRPRKISRESLRGRGGTIPGGAAFTVEVGLQADHDLASCTIHSELYGVVLGLVGMTLERS